MSCQLHRVQREEGNGDEGESILTGLKGIYFS